MKITVVASTVASVDHLAAYGFPMDGMSGDAIAEFAGRACYESWARPNPATAHNQGYLANIIDHGHFNVMEHASTSFYVEEVSRSLLTELERHRHLSFSVRSQRYVDEGNFTAILPPGIEPHADSVLYEDSDDETTVHHALVGAQTDAQQLYSNLCQHLIDQGMPRKQAREAARAVLPNMTETRFIVTGNHRAWRDVISKRNDPHADAEIQMFAKGVLMALKQVAPNSFQDMEP